MNAEVLMTDPRVFEQDVPTGGSIDGELPTAAISTVVSGIVTTRETPALGATFGAQTSIYPGGPNYTGAVRLVGRDAHRRRIIISVPPNAINTAYVVFNENAQQAASGYGLQITQGSGPIALNYAGEIWIQAFNAIVTVGFVAEVDA